MVTANTEGLHEYTFLQSLKKLSCFSHSEENHTAKLYISIAKKKYTF